MLGPGHGGPQLGNATAKFRKGFSLTITCRGYTFIPDLAVFDMYIDETVPELVSSELGTASRLKPGDRCRIIGSPRGQKIETIAGTIVQVPKHLVNYHAGNIEYIEISADVQAGFSGSPVFDEKNAEVVGMVVRGRPGLTLATPIDEIRSELPRYIDNLNHLQHKC